MLRCFAAPTVFGNVLLIEDGIHRVVTHVPCKRSLVCLLFAGVFLIEDAMNRVSTT